jgi:hypothetical protein
MKDQPTRNNLYIGEQWNSQFCMSVTIAIATYEAQKFIFASCTVVTLFPSTNNTHPPSGAPLRMVLA